MKKKSNLELIRLNKFISQSGFCSRRAADKLIIKGKVKVNGKLCKELGTVVSLEDSIKIDEKKIDNEKKVYVLLNKPKSYISTRKALDKKKCILDLIKGIKEKIYPVDILDENTTGILLLTNDNDLTKKLTKLSDNIKQVYSLTLNRNISKKELYNIEKSLKNDIKALLINKMVRLEQNNEIGIEINSTNIKIINQKFEDNNYKVLRSDRVLYGPFTKKDLPRGKWRKLHNNEIRNFNFF